jgi:hypothetical protein
MRNAGFWLAAAGMLASGSGHAADAQVEAGRQCAQVRDSLQRLVCYDRIFQAGDSAAPAAAPRAATPVPAPAPARAPVAASAPVVAAPVVAAPVLAPSLGDEIVQRKAKDKDKAKPAEPTSLEATITALKETRPDVVRLTLDNGQVWQQMDMSSVFQVTVGDTVRVEKGTMGGYRLVRTSRGRSGWVRVTRVE